MTANKTILFLLTFSLTLIISCSGSSTGADPDPGEPEEPNEPTVTTGTLEVTISTTGNGTDGDGYTVTLDGDESKSINPDETITYEDLEEGSYSIELSGLADGCSVTGDNPISEDITGGETTSVTFEVVCEASVDPPEGTVVFAQRIDGTNMLYKMNADGSEEQQIGNGIKGDFPAVSPDGSQIVYTVGASSNAEIWIVNIDGSNPQRLVSDEEGDSFAFLSWSPDGTKIAFDAEVQKDYSNSDDEIFVMNADGTNITQITDHEANDAMPSWAPDGSSVIFTSDRENNESQIYSIDIDNRDVTLLIEANDNNGLNHTDPVWSPDQSKIVYSAEYETGSPRIFIADADGGNAHPLIPEGFFAYSPSWSPNGDHVVFTAVSDIDGNDGIVLWTVNKYGSGLNQLTESGTFSDYPSWVSIGE